MMHSGKPADLEAFETLTLSEPQLLIDLDFPFEGDDEAAPFFLENLEEIGSVLIPNGDEELVRESHRAIEHREWQGLSGRLL